MIRLFRQVSQRLLSQNLPSGQIGEFGKYVLYAIGEVVLVMISILLDLQLNNWKHATQTIA